MPELPDLETFLQAPREVIAALMPPTLVYAQGGTRRDAALHGVDPSDDGYADWSQQRMITTMDLLFNYGVQHIFTIAAAPSQFAEVGRYREKLIGWIVEGLAGAAAIRRWRELGWRIRIVGAEDDAEIQQAAAVLRESLPDTGRTIWWYVNPQAGAHWQRLIALAKQAEVLTQADLIAAWFGEPLPPAKLLLSFGKPIFDADVLPLPLLDRAQCYWSQRPGYSLDETMVRRILYDYRYLRGTWRSDKHNRYATIAQHADIWHRGAVVGLGARLGDFWYPQSELPAP
ncbi:MAG: hypothetical protein HC822_02930 [Oscillochloris sp.]|nr:hypothetical protein [Oscillochloris sp.]